MAVSSDWSAERVLALAPDAAAARAGQALIALKKWTNLGQADDLLWGECQGSGSKPYQTKVVPDDPAFACSCPSRKFPCKHALGLMLIWADPAVPIAEAAPPPWVATWVEARTKRVETRQRQVEAAPADPAAKLKREAARLSKVAAGLDDLDLWLGDLIRSGLVSLATRPKNLWDDQARRLIDAQCPGVARRLRQIDAMSFAGDGWQTALLDRLAQLHLLIEAFRHRANLPPAVLADVRTAIGFPADLDAVRAGAAGSTVRDGWRVLGQAFALEDKVTVRRTWLWGRDSRRSALILDFAAPGRPFEVTFLPGTTVDATLSYFPGAVPLRALLIDRHGPTEPFATLDGGATIAEAQATFGAVLARSPWVEQVAVVLAEVTLRFEAGAWSAVDPVGCSLPLSGPFPLGWSIEGRSGGAPITLAGEFDGTTLNPLGASVAGQFLLLTRPDAKVTAEPGCGSPGRWLTPASGLLTDATAAAVVGVERKTPPPVASEHPIAPIVAGVQRRSAPARLLALAAAGGLHARVGRQAQVVTPPAPSPALVEDRFECSPAAAGRLRSLFAGEFAQETNLSPRLFFEWFHCCDRAGARLPANFLADVLSFVPGRGDPFPAVAAILGARGRWLAGRNPAWNLYAEPDDPPDPVAVWETGARAARLDLLRSLRATDPAEARRLVESTFKAEPAPFRSEVIALFEANLTSADEPVLEAALDDRSQDVRASAARRLRSLPGSRLALRMAERARGLLRWDGDRLLVEPPRDLNPAMARDGITRDPADTKNAGIKGSLLRAVLARTPVAAISAHLGRPPAEILAAAGRTEWGALLVDAWEEAALEHQDPAWCRALALRRVELDEDRPNDNRFPRLFARIDLEERNAVIATLLAASPTPIPSSHLAVRLILATEGPFEVELGRLILRKILGILLVERLNAAAGTQEYFTGSNAVFRTLFEGLDRKLPFALVDEAASLLDHDPAGPQPPQHAMSLRASYEALIDRWKFRRDMHQEFAP